jgi:plastocyanin
LLLIASLAGCRESPLRGNGSLDIGSDTIQLSPGVAVRDVRIRAAGSGEFDPASLAAQAGDVIRFRTADARTHVLAFDEGSLPAGARERFANRSQLRSPPLLVEGATWIVSLQDVPLGEYTFRCLQHGIAGRVSVK